MTPPPELTETRDTPDAPDTTSRPRVLTASFRSPGLWVLTALIVVFAAVAQFIGPLNISVGSTSIIMLPMIWALLLSVAASTQRIRPLSVDLQHVANAIMGVAVLVLIARLSFTLGPNLPLLVDAGPSLIFQELGNVIGPICLALPLAVMLRMGAATVGATFSIDREASFAMVTQRFGTNSAQYRGVLSMYIFGSVFGAVVISIVASVLSSMGIFDWRALAMGAGVGSGSMMAAGAASVSAAHPEVADQILALATSANLIATIAGVYLGFWVALPLADKVYNLLVRRRDAANAASGTDAAAAASAATAASSGTAATADAERATGDLAAAVTDVPVVKMPLWASLAIISLAGVVTSVVATRGFAWGMIVTVVLLSLLVAGSLGIEKITRGKIPALVAVVTVGTLATSPVSPIDGWIAEQAASLDFLHVITMMLAIAGLSIGKDLPLLKQIGWKILPVGIVVIVATYLASTAIAELVLQITG